MANPEHLKKFLAGPKVWNEWKSTYNYIPASRVFSNIIDADVLEKNKIIDLSETDFIEIDLDGLTWFEDSPDAGDPHCLCSLCLDMIKADEVPTRLFATRGKAEIRLHKRCFKKRLVMNGNKNSY